MTFIVALFTRAWIEIIDLQRNYRYNGSPSSRGRGLKCFALNFADTIRYVALFTRAWIEIDNFKSWIPDSVVALFTRAWIEILKRITTSLGSTSRPLHEGVD